MCIFETERTNKQTNKQIQVCAIFYFISEPLNFFDSIMNLIEEFNIATPSCYSSSVGI